MTKNDDDFGRQDAARLRITQITTLFAEMRTMLVRWLHDAGPAAEASSKQMMTKISETQSVLASLIRAEEAFHDKFNTDDIADGIDYDAARDAIGRELDRLRAAFTAGAVFERPDRGAD